MRDEFENIDNLFANELKEHAPAPPAGMWEQIEQRLPQKKSKNTPFLFYRIAASIVLLLSAGSLGVYLITNAPKQEISTAEVLSNETPEIVSALPEIKSEMPDNSTSVSTTPIAVKKSSIEPVYSKQDISNQNTQNQEESYVPTKKENIVLQSESSISSIEPEISAQINKEQTIIYEPRDSKDSEAYKAFLSEFETLDEETPDRQKWSIGGQAGPQYSYRQVSTSSSNVSQEYIDKYNQEESGLIAYAGGVNIAYKPARRLSIQSGIYYSKMGQTAPAQTTLTYDNQFLGAVNPGEWNKVNATTELRVASSMGDIASPPVEKNLEEPNVQADQYENVSQVNQYLEFLEVPLMARYAIIDRKVNFHLLGGLSTNFLIASPIYLDNGDYYTDTKGLNKVNYSSTIGLGLGYNFSSKFTFSIEPQFKYYLNKVNNDPETDVHPYSFGVFTGVTYLF